MVVQFQKNKTNVHHPHGNHMNVYPNLERQVQYIYNEDQSSSAVIYLLMFKICQDSTTDNIKIQSPNVHLQSQQFYYIVISPLKCCLKHYTHPPEH